MQQILTTIKDAYNAYSSFGINLTLLWIAIIYLYIQEESRQKRNLMYAVLVMMFLLLNPFTANNIVTFYMENESYHRIFAIIPSGVIIAYGMAKAVSEEKKKMIGRGLLCCFVVVLLVSVNLTFTTENIGLTGNKYKVSDEVRELQQIVSELGNVYVIAPREIGEQLREYDLSVRVMGGDDEKWGVINDISQNWTDSEKIKNYAVTYGANCIICPKEEKQAVGLDSKSFSIVAETKKYRVYVLV